MVVRKNFGGIRVPYAIFESCAAQALNRLLQLNYREEFKMVAVFSYLLHQKQHFSDLAASAIYLESHILQSPNCLNPACGSDRCKRA